MFVRFSSGYREVPGPHKIWLLSRFCLSVIPGTVDKDDTNSNAASTIQRREPKRRARGKHLISWMNDVEKNSYNNVCLPRHYIISNQDIKNHHISNLKQTCGNIHTKCNVPAVHILSIFNVLNDDSNLKYCNVLAI